MDLNFDIIYDALSRQFSLRRCGTAPKELHIHGPRFFEEGWDEDHIYIFQGQPPRGFAAPAVFLGTPQGWEPPQEAFSNPVIFVQTPCTADGVMNALLTVYEEYSAWDERLQRAMDEQVELGELTCIAAERLGNRVLINDKKLRLLADSRFYREKGEDPRDYEGMLLPEEIVKAIIEEDIAGASGKREPFFSGADGRYFGCLVYNMNFFIDEEYEGTCSLMAEQKPFQDSDLALFRHFYQYARSKFLTWRGLKEKHGRPLKAIVQDFLNGTVTQEQMRMEARAYQEGFTNYRCIVIRGQQYEYMRAVLEKTFTECVGILYENQLVELIPGLEEADLLRLNQQLIPLGAQVGVSMRGDALASCRQLYLQAEQAIEMQDSGTERPGIFCFEDCLLRYLLRHSTGVLDRNFLKTDGFHRLEQFNSTAKADYMETLRVYLDEEMQITATAKRLYLHRSSVLKRLEQLHRLLGRELETPEGRLLLRWQLYCADAGV